MKVNGIDVEMVPHPDKPNRLVGYIDGRPVLEIDKPKPKKRNYKKRTYKTKTKKEEDKKETEDR